MTTAECLPKLLFVQTDGTDDRGIAVLQQAFARRPTVVLLLWLALALCLAVLPIQSSFTSPTLDSPYQPSTRASRPDLDSNQVRELSGFQSRVQKCVRLAGSEEILPLPDIALKEYNPLHHERGFHLMLNALVKDSLQFGSIAPLRCERRRSPRLIQRATDTSIAGSLGEHVHEPEGEGQRRRPNLRVQRAAEDDHDNTVVPSSERQAPEPAQGEEAPEPSQEKKASPSISEEWEKLIIIDDNDDFCTPVSSSSSRAPLFHRPPVVSTLPSPVKPLDEKTSRILERLEAPKAKKQRAGKPPGAGAATASGRGGGGGSSTLVKKPLLPFEPRASQPLKPSFNRVRRKAVS
ncbi:Sialyltransferase-like protein 5 [Hordeum vulgare]|nr:Sialyltransferase-like protein 5 [Hordeum vulgare]